MQMHWSDHDVWNIKQNWKNFSLFFIEFQIVPPAHVMKLFVFLCSLQSYHSYKILLCYVVYFWGLKMHIKQRVTNFLFNLWTHHQNTNSQRIMILKSSLVFLCMCVCLLSACLTTCTVWHRKQENISTNNITNQS